MTAKEILSKIKAVFADTPPTTTAPASNVMQYNVDGGDPVYVDISDDGIADIDAGDPVYADAALTTPYPDGMYTVSGSTFSFTVASGVVTEVNGVLAPVTSSVDTPVAPPPATLPNAPLFQAMEKKLTAQEAEIVSLKAALQDAKKLINKHEKIFPDLFELVEKLTQLPVSEPKTLTGRQQEVFNRQNSREQKLVQIAENLKKIKSK